MTQTKHARGQAYDRPNNEYGAYLELLDKMDASEPFMRGGHKVVKPRHKTKVIPDWALDDVKIQEIVLRSFPKLHIDGKQRAGAARWVRVIFLYFRREFTEGQIAYFLGNPNEDGSDIIPMPITAVRRLIWRVEKAATGKTWRGLRRGRRGRTKNGV
jgi:hypothetical protein